MSFWWSLCGACDQIKIQGSRVADRDEAAWLADYFYLPTDFSSTITVHPTIQNFLIDFFGYVGLDQWVTGLYAWIQAPLTWTNGTSTSVNVSKPQENLIILRLFCTRYNPTSKSFARFFIIHTWQRTTSGNTRRYYRNV